MNHIEVKSDLRLVLDRIPLGFSAGRLQRPIQPGRIGLHIVGGRVRDRDGAARVYVAGERPAMMLLASRLGGIPGLGHVDQEVVEFAVNPGRISANVSHVLLGISQDEMDAAFVRLVCDFRLTDPVQLLEQLPDWRQDGGVDVTNQRINDRVCDAANTAVSARLGDPLATQSYLSSGDLSMIQSDFRTILDRTFRDWGLEIVDSVSPTRQYPRALVRLLYEVRLGASEFQLRLQRDAARAAAELGIREYEARKLANLGPAGLFVDLANKRPEVAMKMIDASTQVSQSTAEVMRTVLLTSSTDSELSKRVLLSALQQQQTATAFGIPGVGLQAEAAGLPGLDVSVNNIFTASGLNLNASPAGLPFDVSAPTVVGATPYASPASETNASRLAKIVDDELMRARSAGAEVEKVGAPTSDGQVVEVTVDDQIVYRLTVSSDVSDAGPRIDHVLVRGTKMKTATHPTLLPAWRKGDHLDALVTLAKSGYFDQPS